MYFSIVISQDSKPCDISVSWCCFIPSYSIFMIQISRNQTQLHKAVLILHYMANDETKAWSWHFKSMHRFDDDFIIVVFFIKHNTRYPSRATQSLVCVLQVRNKSRIGSISTCGRWDHLFELSPISLTAERTHSYHHMTRTELPCLTHQFTFINFTTTWYHPRWDHKFKSQKIFINPRQNGNKNCKCC